MPETYSCLGLRELQVFILQHCEGGGVSRFTFQRPLQDGEEYVNSQSLVTYQVPKDFSLTKMELLSKWLFRNGKSMLEKSRGPPIQSRSGMGLKPIESQNKVKKVN